MREKKTVAIVAPYFPPHPGGLERYVCEIATRLARDHAWRVVVITTSERDGRDRREQRDGITLYRLAYSVRISQTPFSFGWLWKVPRILRSEKPDIVNVHLPVPGIGDIAAFFTPRKKLVLTYHAGSMRKERVFADLFIWLYEHGPLQYLLKKVAHIICVSDFVRHGFLARYKDKSTTITPAVDSATFHPARAQKAASPAVITVGGTGNNRHKGLRDLMDATALARGEVPNIRLVVIGSNYEAERAYARARGLGSAVRFLGALNGEKLAAQYRRAHIFALATKNDSFAMVILEAGASGLPVVATKVGGIPSLVKDRESGFLVEPGDTHGLAKKIVALARDPALAARLGKQGRKNALAYRWRTRAGAYDALLTRLCKPAPLIAHLIASYPPRIGGMERVASEAATRLAARGHSVSVITGSGSIMQHSIERHGTLTLRRIPSRELFHVPIAPTLLLELLSLPRQTILHLHLAQAYWPETMLLAAAVRRLRYIVHFHLDVGPSSALGPLFLLYKKLVWGPLLRGAEEVIVCTSAQKRLIAEKYGVARERITVIPNAVNEDFFSRKPYAPARDALRLLYVGRLAAQKRLERLIEAMPLVTSPATLTLVGEGEERKKLEALAKKLRLQNIRFAGVKGDREIRTYHGRSDVFIISSDQEGLPLSVLEAMAAGLPVIASNVTGLRELLRGVGILVNEPYPREFAKAIDRVAREPERLKECSAQSASKARAYGWMRVVRRLEGVYARAGVV